MYCPPDCPFWLPAGPGACEERTDSLRLCADFLADYDLRGNKRLAILVEKSRVGTIRRFGSPLALFTASAIL